MRIEPVGEPQYATCPTCGNKSLRVVDAVLTAGDDPIAIGRYDRCEGGCDDGEITMRGRAAGTETPQ